MWVANLAIAQSQIRAGPMRSPTLHRRPVATARLVTGLAKMLIVPDVISTRRLQRGPVRAIALSLGAVLFLVSDAVNFVNGEIIHADGGQHVAGPVLNPSKFTA